MERVKEAVGLGHREEGQGEARMHQGTVMGMEERTGTTRTGTEGFNTTTTTTTGAEMKEHLTSAETATTGHGQPAVCGQEYFVRTEDRPVVKEYVERILEHRPVEKEFVVETRATGVERLLKDQVREEVISTTERVVEEAAPRGPCE